MPKRIHSKFSSLDPTNAVNHFWHTQHTYKLSLKSVDGAKEMLSMDRTNELLRIISFFLLNEFHARANIFKCNGKK